MRIRPIWALCLFWRGFPWAQEPGAGDSSVSDLSLRDMLNLTITSVSKKTERLQDAAASVYVITEEDIRRSGAIRIQDVLNLVPGVWYAENSFTSPNSAVRDEPTPLAQSINVLLDGVPLATNIYGSVYYDGLEIPLSGIERIEAIRGGGGTIYGANSATGIINIISKKPDESEGGYARISGGTQEYVSPYVRYGRILSDKAAFSSYVMFKHHAGYAKNPDFTGDVVTAIDTSGQKTAVVNRFNSDEPEKRDALSMGVNASLQPTLKSRLNASISFRGNQGKEYSGVSFPYPQTVGLPRPDSIWVETVWNSHFCVNTRCDYAFHENHAAFVRLYYTLSDNNFAYLVLGTARFKAQMLNMETQDNITLFQDKPVRLELNFGANSGIEYIDATKFSETARVRVVNGRDTTYFAAAFVQDKLSFGDYVDLTSGVKAEIRTIVGVTPEYSPSVRLSVKPNHRLTLWSALSRNVTTPGYSQTRVEARMVAIPPAWAFTLPLSQGGMGMHPDSVPAGAGKWMTVVNTDSIRPAKYRTLEAGVRSAIHSKLSFEAGAFATLFNDRIYVLPDTTLRTVCISKVYGDTIVPMYYANIHKGKSYGMEAVVKASIFNFSRLELSYAWFRTKKEGQILSNGTKAEVANIPAPLGPEHVIRGRLYIDAPGGVNVSLHALWYSEIASVQAFNYIDQKPDERNVNPVLVTPPRLKLDCMVEKSLLGTAVSLYAWGKNILYGGYIESFDRTFTPYPHTVHRTFGGGISYRF